MSLHDILNGNAAVASAKTPPLDLNEIFKVCYELKQERANTACPQCGIALGLDESKLSFHSIAGHVHTDCVPALDIRIARILCDDFEAQFNSPADDFQKAGGEYYNYVEGKWTP